MEGRKPPRERDEIIASTLAWIASQAPDPQGYLTWLQAMLARKLPPAGAADLRRCVALARRMLKDGTVGESAGAKD